MPPSQYLEQKLHDSVLSPTIPMSPHIYSTSNTTDLDTEAILVDTTIEESTTETAMIIHEKPTSFDNSNNDFLIKSYYDTEQQKELAVMHGAEINLTSTSLQTVGASSSSFQAMSNETFVEPTPEDEDMDERVSISATLPLQHTSANTPPPPLSTTTSSSSQPQSIQEHHDFVDQHQDTIQGHPVIQDVEEINCSLTQHTRISQDLTSVKSKYDQEGFGQPIQAVYTMHQGSSFGERQEPNFIIKSANHNIKKKPYHEKSLKSKCMKLIRGMKTRLSQEKKQKTKENRMKATFSESSTDQEQHIETNCK